MDPNAVSEELRASERAKELEREAVALVKQYGFFMPPPVKAFLRKMAAHLNWTDLKGILK